MDVLLEACNKLARRELDNVSPCDTKPLFP